MCQSRLFFCFQKKPGYAFGCRNKILGNKRRALYLCPCLLLHKIKGNLPHLDRCTFVMRWLYVDFLFPASHLVIKTSKCHSGSRLTPPLKHSRVSRTKRSTNNRCSQVYIQGSQRPRQVGRCVKMLEEAQPHTESAVCYSLTHLKNTDSKLWLPGNCS